MMARRSSREDAGGERRLKRLDALGISRPRILLVHCVLALLVGGSLWALVADREWWPFSPYPMYSWIADGESVTRLRLYGVTAEEPRREILLTDPKYTRFVEVFDSDHLHWAFLAIARSEEDQEELRRKLKEAARDVGKRYEERRLRGHHDGPPLRALRLYQMRWRPGVDNVDRPDKRQLIVKARLKPRSGP